MNSNQTVVRLGIDPGKNRLHLWGVNADDERVLKKQVSRGQVLHALRQLPPCRVGLEAGGGAHDWARELTELGHDVRLMAPQLVKPSVKGHKNDFNDAEAICEAVGRANLRFVAPKTVEQQGAHLLVGGGDHCFPAMIPHKRQLKE